MIALALEPTIRAPLERPLSSDPRRRSSQPGKVLVVDDRAVDRETLQAILECGDYEIFTAGNGVDALKILRHEHPDLLITDLMMPTMDGYALVRQMRAEPEIAATRVIVYTGTYRQCEAKALADASGALRFITKPMEPETMLALVDTVLHENAAFASVLMSPEALEAAHLRLITDKLVEKAAALEVEIVARRATEEQLRMKARLLDLTHDAIIVRDMDDRIELWSDGAERLYGWKRAEVVGRKASEFLLTATAEEQLTALKALLADGEWSGECRHHTQSGATVNVEARWTLIRDEAGQPQARLIINTDVTERRKFERQSIHAQRLESIGTLASGVAHDLNNILSPILMAVPLLRGEMPASAREKLVALVETSAERGAAIVRQVLTFARGADGERVLIQPAHLLKEIANIVEETFPKSIGLCVSFPEDLSIIEGDPTQLHQVLLNLCVNARDAMPDGGRLVLAAANFNLDAQYATMVPGTTPGPYVLITVTNSGPGIPADIMEKIFDPFFTTKEIGKGTGLGLSTSLGIVRSHGGAINASSIPHEGTTFRVLFPAAAGLYDEHARKQELDFGGGRGETILLVDDEPAIREVAQALLESRGYRVLTAEDGPTAFALFALKRADIAVVITDSAMPLMSGLALARVLRKMDPDAKIVMSSGLEDDISWDAPEGIGCRALLTKPYSQEALLRTLDQVLHTGHIMNKEPVDLIHLDPLINAKHDYTPLPESEGHESEPSSSR